MASDLETWLELLEARVEKASAERESQGADVREIRALLAQLVELLCLRGDFIPGHKRLLQKIAHKARRPVKLEVKLDTAPDKYEIENPDVDCASLLPLCHGRCCSFEVRIAEQDIREGKLEWEILDPYVLPRAADGFCQYLDRDNGLCGCYEHRPGTCRHYDCRADKRVWLDYEKRIPAPLPNHVVPLGRLLRRDSDESPPE